MKIKLKVTPKVTEDTSKITSISPADFANNAMKDYATYVMQERAIAAVADGLKPVQRRILYSAYLIGAKPNKPHIKSARIVAETMGKFHPHGDSAIYQTMVNLTKPNFALVDGHGNFGSETDPGCAAMRYTEARLSPFGMSMFDEIHVANMIPNYDGKDQEPEFLPAKLPIAVINGSEGIGVGLSANLPPHNLGEIVDSLLSLLKNPDSDDLFSLIQGPDYGSGIIVSPKSEVRKLYEDGTGSIRYRCKYHYEVIEGVNTLVITQFAPRFQYEKFIGRAKELEEEGVVTYISDSSSHKTGMRICVGFKSPKLVKDKLLKLLRTSCSYQLNLLGPNKTFTNYSMRNILLDFLDYRRGVEQKVLEHEKAECELNLSKEQAKLAASLNLEELVKLLKKRLEEDQLVPKIVKALSLASEDQARFLLSCQIRILSRISREKTEENIKALNLRLEEIAKDMANIDGVVSRTLNDMKSKFNKARGTIHSSKEPEVAKATGSIYFGITELGQYSKSEKFPSTNKQEFKFLTVTDDTVTVITDNGRSVLVEAQATQRGNLGLTGTKVVGLVPSTSSRVLVVDTKGNALVFDNKRMKAGVTEFSAMNTNAKLLGAWPLNVGDQVVVWNKSFYAVHENNALTVKRYGSRGYRLLSGSSGYNVVVVPDGCKLFTIDGDLIKDFSSLQKEKLSPEEIVVVNKRGKNMVLIGEKKIQVSSLEIESLLSKKQVTGVFPEL